MSRNNQSLLGGVLWKVLPVSIAVLIGIWVVVIQVSKHSLEEETTTRIRERAEGLVLATDTRFSNILAAVRNLAATSLIVNTLIHEDFSEQASGGDKSYIHTFFRSLKIAGLRQVSLKLLDYQGRQLVGAVDQDYRQQPWVDWVMGREEHLFIDAQRRLFHFAVPIEYQGSPEGILLLEVERRVLLEFLGENLPIGAVLVRTQDHAVLYSALWGVDDELGFVDVSEEESGLIEHEQPLQLFPAITLRYGEGQEEALASLEKLHQTLLLVLVLDLIALLAGIVVAGRAVVRPIANMASQLKRAQKRGSQQNTMLRLEGIQEIDHLVTTYNQLQQTTERLNHRLKEQFEKMEQVFSSMADALLVLDEGGTIVEANPAAERLLNVPVEQLVNQPVSRYLTSQQEGGEVLLQPVDGDEIPALLAESSSEDSRYTIWLLHDLRERIKAEQQEQYGAFQAGIAEMGASVIHNIGNAITGMLGQVTHISKQMQAVDRVAGLLQEQGRRKLGEKGVEPERLLEAMSRSGELLQRVSGEKGVGDALQRLNHAIKHVGEVISIQQGAARPEVHASQFRFSSLLSDTLGLIQDDLAKRGISVQADQGETLPRLLLPRNPMIQLLLNLIKNSMEAIESQMLEDSQLQGRVELTTRLLAENRFELRIRDNGCGLAQDRLTEVFHSRVSTKERGSGYGLHSAGNFVGSLGGEIQLLSEGEGRGAEMVIRLPLWVERNRSE